MNYLITGGAGFLGAALSNRLSQQGHLVRVLDDLFHRQSGCARSRDPLHARRYQRPSKIAGLSCRILTASTIWQPAFRCLSRSCFPRDYNEVNVGGTATLMEAARDAGTPRVVLTSSGAIYGNQDKPLLTESMQPPPKLTLCTSQAGIRVVRQNDRRPLRDRDDLPAHLQRLRPRPAHPPHPTRL